MSWQTNEDTVRTYVENNCTKYDKKAQNASLTRENGAFNFVAGTEGLELNVVPQSEPSLITWKTAGLLTIRKC